MNSRKPDTVTMTLFSRELDNGSFDRGFLAEKQNVYNLITGLSRAAYYYDQKLDFVLTVNLIPNWKREGNSYTDPTYLKVKADFLNHVRKHFYYEDLYENPVIRDFYTSSKLTKSEKNYLHQLRSGGINADMMKTRAIIDNADRNHLQIDTNTKVASFIKLYHQTFIAKHCDTQDKLNACYYDHHYVSAHNKVVYTAVNGSIAKELTVGYREFIHDNLHNEEHKDKDSNALYGILFIETLKKLGLTYDRVQDNKKNKAYCPARLDRNEYALTDTIVSAVNRSWENTNKQNQFEELKQINAMPYGDASFDFSAFLYLVKKYTGLIYLHDEAVQKYTVSQHSPRKKFLRLADIAEDMNNMSGFYNFVFAAQPDDLLIQLSQVFPNTYQGNRLTQVLFQCSVDELRKGPFRFSIVDMQKGEKFKQLHKKDNSSISTSKSTLFAVEQKDYASHTNKIDYIERNDIVKTV